MAKLKSLAYAGVLGVMLSSSAFAADMLRPQNEPLIGTPERALEFGTGWYLRGDASVSRETVPAFFPGGLPGFEGKTQTLGNVTLGAGYKFNNWFRTDLTFDYRQQLKATTDSASFNCPIEIRGLNDGVTGAAVGIYAVNNQCVARQSAKLTRMALMGNAYVDLGTWSGVTPYIGAGVGLSHSKVRGSYDWIDQAAGTHYGPTLVIPGGYPIIWMDAFGNPVAPGTANFGVQNRAATLNKNKINIAFAGMAGFAVDVSANAKIDFGYRYLNLGKIGAESAKGVHEFRLGFRYMAD